MELLLSAYVGCAALVLPALPYYGAGAGVLALGIVARGPARRARVRHLTGLWDARGAWLRAEAADRPRTRTAYDAAIIAAASDRAFPLRAVAQACHLSLDELAGLLAHLSVARQPGPLDRLWQRRSPDAVRQPAAVRVAHAPRATVPGRSISAH